MPDADVEHAITTVLDIVTRGCDTSPETKNAAQSNGNGGFRL